MVKLGLGWNIIAPCEFLKWTGQSAFPDQTRNEGEIEQGGTIEKEWSRCK